MNLLTLDQAMVQVEFLKIYRYGRNLKVFNRTRKMPSQNLNKREAILRRLLKDFVGGLLKKYVEKVSIKKYESNGMIVFSEDFSNKLAFLISNGNFLEKDLAQKVNDVNNKLSTLEVRCSFRGNRLVGFFPINAVRNYETVKSLVSFKETLEKEIVPFVDMYDSIKEGVEEKKEVLRKERIEKARIFRERQQQMFLEEKQKRKELQERQKKKSEEIQESLKALLLKREDVLKEHKEKQKEIELQREKEDREQREKRLEKIEQLKATMEKSAERNQTSAQQRFNSSLQSFLERQS